MNRTFLGAATMLLSGAVIAAAQRPLKVYI